MDQNNSTTPVANTPAPQPMTSTDVPSTVPPPSAVTPTPETPVMVQTASPKGHKKMILITLLVIILLALIGGGAYYFFISQANMSQSEVINAPDGTTVGAELKVLEDEVNSTPLDDVESQFTEIDQDLQKL